MRPVRYLTAHSSNAPLPAAGVAAPRGGSVVTHATPFTWLDENGNANRRHVTSVDSRIESRKGLAPLTLSDHG